MAPEQCRGIGNADQRSDIYALGCVLFDTLTGRPPFERNAAGEYIAAHMHEDAPAPSELVQELPPAVDALVARCLAKDPEERYQTMGDLVAAIEHAASYLSQPGVPVDAHAPATSAMALPSGFSSIFQDNAHPREDTETVVPRPRRSFARFMVATVLTGIVVVALLAAYDSILAERAAGRAAPVEASAQQAAAPEPAPPPAPAAAPAAPPPAPAAEPANTEISPSEIDRELDELLKSADKEPSLALPEEKTAPKQQPAARRPPPPPAQQKPQPQQSPPPAQPAPRKPEPNEDLYDSR